MSEERRIVRKSLKFALILLVVLPVLALTVIGLATVAFVARVGKEKAYEVAFQALNEAIAAKRAEEKPAGAPQDLPAAAPKDPHVPVLAPLQKTLSSEFVTKYGPATDATASEKCLEVADDPDRLLECIRKANSAGDALRNGASEVAGRSLDIAKLPLFDPTSSAAMKIRDGQSAIDYVNVRFSPRRSKDKVTTKVRLQRLEGSRFLVLSGHAKSEWLLDDSLPEKLTGILLLTRREAPEGRIRGVPEEYSRLEAPPLPGTARLSTHPSICLEHHAEMPGAGRRCGRLPERPQAASRIVLEKRSEIAIPNRR